MKVYTLIEDDILGDRILSVHSSREKATAEIEELVQNPLYKRQELRIEEYEVDE